MKTFIIIDELYPYYVMQETSYYHKQEHEVIDEFYKEYLEVEEKFYKMQAKLDGMYNGNKE